MSCPRNIEIKMTEKEMDVNLENLMGDGLGIGAHDESYNGK